MSWARPRSRGQLRRRHSEIGGVAEEFEGRVRLLELGQSGGDPHLDPAVARRLLLGAGEEGERRLRVAEVERGLAGAHQGGDALRIGGEAAQVARQRGLRALGEDARGVPVCAEAGAAENIVPAPSTAKPSRTPLRNEVMERLERVVPPGQPLCVQQLPPCGEAVGRGPCAAWWRGKWLKNQRFSARTVIPAKAGTSGKELHGSSPRPRLSPG